jgi:hypothetical protein
MQRKCKLLKYALWKILNGSHAKKEYSLLHYKWNAGKNPRAAGQMPQKARGVWCKSA